MICLCMGEEGGGPRGGKGQEHTMAGGGGFSLLHCLHRWWSSSPKMLAKALCAMLLGNSQNYMQNCNRHVGVHACTLMLHHDQGPSMLRQCGRGMACATQSVHFCHGLGLGHSTCSWPWSSASCEVYHVPFPFEASIPGRLGRPSA